MNIVKLLTAAGAALLVSVAGSVAPIDGAQAGKARGQLYSTAAVNRFCKGAQGIIVPQVETGAEAAEAVRLARYVPDGERGSGRNHLLIEDDLDFGDLSPAEWTRICQRAAEAN